MAFSQSKPTYLGPAVGPPAKIAQEAGVDGKKSSIRCHGSLSIDSKTKCEHYNSDLDIVGKHLLILSRVLRNLITYLLNRYVYPIPYQIGMKMRCCDKYFSCIHCHSMSEDHESLPWPVDKFDTLAILCGNCESELSISSYLRCDNRCPSCQAGFNPGCKNHYHYYFELETEEES
jgi:uncharacterized CHY-type Zn-finger protein